jgi:hypothetical protein
MQIDYIKSISNNEIFHVSIGDQYAAWIILVSNQIGGAE